MPVHSDSFLIFIRFEPHICYIIISYEKFVYCSNWHLLLAGNLNTRLNESQSLTPASLRKTKDRYIPQAPERILDAPDFVNDYCKVTLKFLFKFRILLYSIQRTYCTPTFRDVGTWGPKEPWPPLFSKLCKSAPLKPKIGVVMSPF